jgi:hypothetical protein
MKTIVPTLCCLLVLACEEKKATPPTVGPGPVQTMPKKPMAQPTAQPSARGPAAEGPLNLDEARYQKWVEFRTAFNAAVHKGVAENLQAHAGKKDEPAIEAMSDLHATGQGMQTMTGEIEALRSKYGFTDAEDKRIWNAAAAVSAAKLSESAMLAPTIASMKKLAEQDGPGKEGAMKFLKEQEEREAKQLAAAKTEYGEGAVAVLSAHHKDLQKMQTDAVGAVFGTKK